MVFKSILGATCICACLASPVVTATTVWSVDLINENDYNPLENNPWTMYIVTEEDQLSESVIPTGVYIDQFFQTSDIDPTMLLSSTPQQFAIDREDPYDIFTMDGSTISFETSQLAPGVFELARLDISFAEQIYEPGLLKQLVCWSGVSNCLVGPGYRDPVIGASHSFFYADGGVLTVAASTVPIPPALWLFGSGLLGIIGVARRKVRV